MAINFYTFGPCMVNYDGVNLGFCEDRVEVTIQSFFDDIHVDSWGGLAGPFADRQLLGGVAQINCLFTKFDEAEMQKLTSFVEPSEGDAGEIGPTSNPGGFTSPTNHALGAFIFQDGLYATLILQGTLATNGALQFTHASVANAISFNCSMRHRRWQVQFLCRMADPCDGVIYTQVSGTSCFDD